MSPRDVLREQFRVVYDAATANVRGMTHEDSLAQPGGGGNCANWILSHLLFTQNGVMRTLGTAPVWDDDRLSGPRSAPIVDPGDALDWEVLRDRFLGSKDRCLEALEALDDGALAEEVPGPFGGVTTRAGLLGFLAFHQAYHVGQLGMARRVAGHEGAIRGPAGAEAVEKTP